MDDPNAFLVFASDGSIHPRLNLDAKQKKRAEQTLCIFGLGAEWGRLRRMRQQATLAYLYIIEGMEALTEEERYEYISEEIAKIGNLPFCTTIRHFLERYL